MKTICAVVFAFCFALALALSSAAPAAAQEKKAAKAKEDRLEGTVHMINKDTSTITLRRGNVQRQVVYAADTKFTKVNKPGATIDEIKDGTRLICLGKFDEKGRLVATRIDIRLPR
jgi:Cu/Ag efflux protein CusF